MVIKITRKSNSILLDQIKAIWKFKKDTQPWPLTVFPIVSLFLGTIFLLINFAYYKAGESFWKSDSIFGMVLFIFPILFYLSKYISKKTIIERTRRTIEEYEKQRTVTEIVLTESIIQLKDFQTSSEIRWSAVKNIKISKDHIFFLMDNYYKDFFIISKSEMEENDAQVLINFIRNQKHS